MVTSKQVTAAACHQLVQLRAGKRTVGNNALIVSVINDFPTFGIIVAGADREEIEALYQDDLEKFRDRREEFLLYAD